MVQTITTHFDGQAIVPDEPVHLPIGRPLRIQVEVMEPGPPPFADLVRFEADLPDAPTDLAAQHDHYLYGSKAEY